MKVLVTGGAGYIGSTLVPLLLEHGHHVAVLDSLLYGIGPILPLFREPRFSLVRGDIRDRQVLADAAFDADAVVHLAAVVGYPACAQRPDEAQSTNVEGTRNLAAVAGRSRPVVFASTSSCYGAVADGLCTEQTPLRPQSLYAATKAQAEAALLDGCQAVVYRMATAFGLSPRLRLDLMVNDFVHRAIHERRVTVYEGHFRRSFLHVRDMARAILLALEQSSAMAGQVFNVGDQRQNHSKLDLCRIIQEVLPGVEIETCTSGRDLDRRDYVVSYARIEALGFRATVPVRGGIEELARALRFIECKETYGNVGGTSAASAPGGPSA